MITSVFNKSKAINLIVIFLITLFAYVFPKLKEEPMAFSMGTIASQCFSLFIVYVSILLINFMASKNSLTKNNSFEMLLFSLFLLTVRESVDQPNIVLSNFFILLSLRRIVSLRTQKEVKKKLFDAGLWIAVAALFFNWAFLFFILLLAAVILFTDANVKYWVIPFLGVLTVCAIGVVFSIALTDSYVDLFHVSFETNYDFKAFYSSKYMVPLLSLLFVWGWSSFFYFRKIKKMRKEYRAPFQMIYLACLTALLIVVQAPSKSGSIFLFLLAPLAIIVTAYLETMKEKWSQELFFTTLILFPFVFLML